jgi:hypothetical protein
VTPPGSGLAGAEMTLAAETLLDAIAAIPDAPAGEPTRRA